MNLWWSYNIGYLFAIVISHFPIPLVIDRMWGHIGCMEVNKDNIRPESGQPRILGCVERGLYIAAFQFDELEFIDGWLSLKVAGQWKRLGDDKKYAEHVIAGHAVYEIFLIGSALSISYAVTGAKLVEWCLRQKWSLAIGVPVSLLLATLVLGYWIGCYRDDN